MCQKSQLHKRLLFAPNPKWEIPQSLTVSTASLKTIPFTFSLLAKNNPANIIPPFMISSSNPN